MPGDLATSLVWPGSPPTSLGFGFGLSEVLLGVEYGTSWLGVSRVIEIANVDCSGLPVIESAGIRAGGTGMYVLIRDRREVFCTECSGNGPFGVCMLTARPLKQGILKGQERMDLVNES